MNKMDEFVTIASLVLFLLLPRTARAEEDASQINPAQVDLALQEVQKICQRETDNDTVPGIAIAVVFQNHLTLTAGFGVRDVETRAPVDADTVFQLASLSKPIGATVVAALISDGKISWDSRISDLDPDFAKGLRILLPMSHCMGKRRGIG